jgi:hypothetical protein
LNGLKYGISDNKLLATLVAGFLATQIATIVGFWHEIIDFPAMDWNRFNGTYLVGGGNPTAIAFQVPPASDFEVFITGWLFHLFTGLTLTAVYTFVIRPQLPLAYSKWSNLAAGMAFGVLLAVISFTILTPLLDPYNANPGWFSLDLRLADTNGGGLHPGWKTPIAIIFWHLVYGFHLGSFYNPTPEAEGVAEARPMAAAPSTPAPAAVGAGGS